MIEIKLFNDIENAKLGKHGSCDVIMDKLFDNKYKGADPNV